MGYGAALAPLKALPREVWADGRPPGSVPSESGSVGGRTGSLRLQTPWSPGRNSEQLFGLSWQSGCRADVNTEARQEGEGQGGPGCHVWAAGCHTGFPGATARQRHRCQVSWREPAAGGVTQTRALASPAW